MTLKCKKCMFFVKDDVAIERFECRKRAPVMFPECPQWPIVKPDDFCGDFYPSDETRMQEIFGKGYVHGQPE